MHIHAPYRFPTRLNPLLPGVITRMPGNTKTLYLTFDDGPDPEITPYVTEILRDYHAHATFFLIGDRILRNRKLAEDLAAEGHLLANHTMYHENAWKTPCKKYLKSIDRTRFLLETIQKNQTRFFRPPYGKWNPFCLPRIKKQTRMVLWSYLSLDYDRRIDPAVSLKVLEKNLKPGHIVVFHDSRKAFPSLKYLLPKLLEIFSKRGFDFKALF